MNTSFRIALVTAGLLSAVELAAAQDTVVIAPEQQTVIREYVQKNPVASIELPGIELSIGATLPDTVELHRVDAPDVTYEYVVVGGRTVLVDPGTRKVVHVMD